MAVSNNRITVCVSLCHKGHRIAKGIQSKILHSFCPYSEQVSLNRFEFSLDKIECKQLIDVGPNLLLILLE